MLSLKTHNILDYVAGVFLLFVPAIFGFSQIDVARNFFIVAGVGLIGYSLLTRYEYAIFRTIPIGVHMGLDVAIGVATILAPWVFGYRDLLTGGQEVVHYLLGLGVIGFVAVTRTKTSQQAERGQTFSTTFYDRDRRAS